ncbi:hypothetical protein GQ44DRAFT_768961 [Phaeosphaeriaceae sp. PMI808]|nr:hypothetical protein GQ44DRAFT_768961 [Phaeosphaeriaceae sp. PMI808]
MASERQHEVIPGKEIQSVPDSDASSAPAPETTLKAAHHAAIMDLEQGTGIKKHRKLRFSQSAWTLSIFYYPYIFFEPLATLMLEHFNPSVWMPQIIFTWRILSMSQGATQN